MLRREELEQICEKIYEKQSKKCPECNQNAKEVGKYMYRCTWSCCRNTFSLLKNTIFFKCKTKHYKILRILDLWLRKTRIDLIAYIVRVNIKVVKSISKKVEKIISKYYESLQSIGAHDVIVEIDESKFGKRKYNKGHHVEGVWILGMVERTAKRRVVLLAVDDRTKETLRNKIVKHVSSKSSIYTDCWKGYNDLHAHFNSHSTVNHSKEFVNFKTGVHTNSIEGTWFAVKAQVPNRNRTRKNIGLYLLRFMLNRNAEMHPLLDLIKFL